MHPIARDATTNHKADTIPTPHQRAQYATTPDGRYFIVHGRLWRCSNPKLSTHKRTTLVRELMRARAAKARAMKAHDEPARQRAMRAVNTVKIALGERGKPWWRDDAPDYNRHMVKNTPYATWFRKVR